MGRRCRAAGDRRTCANPLLLTAICIVYGENRKLPQDEFDLYDRIEDTVLFNADFRRG